MFSIVRIVRILILFQTSLALDFATEKEALKKSLLQVDNFLELVGQKIQLERNYLHTLDNISNSDKTKTINAVNPIANEWKDGKYDTSLKTNDFNNPPDAENDKFNKYFQSILETDNKSKIKNSLRDGSNGNEKLNIMKILATLDETKTSSTKKLSLAVIDIKGLVEQDTVKDPKNADVVADKFIKEVRKKFNLNQFKNNKPVSNDIKSTAKPMYKGRRKENDPDFDAMFGEDAFPSISKLPQKLPTTTPTTPTEAIMKPNFIQDDFEHIGPENHIVHTPQTTTHLDDMLLDPREFGYTTTHKPLPVYGDLEGTPQINATHLLTTKLVPDLYSIQFRKEMQQHSMGVFSITVKRMFNIVMTKPEPVAKQLVDEFSRVVEFHNRDEKLHFGQPTNYAFVKSTGSASMMPFDETKAKATMLHHGMIHRREMFAQDINSILDYIDSLYLKSEENKLISVMKEVQEYNNETGDAYPLLNNLLNTALAPYTRTKDLPGGKILNESLNRGIRNHFYPTEQHFPPARRTYTFNAHGNNNVKDVLKRMKQRLVRRNGLQHGIARNGVRRDNNIFSNKANESIANNGGDFNDLLTKPVVTGDLRNLRDVNDKNDNKKILVINKKDVVQQPPRAIPDLVMAGSNEHDKDRDTSTKKQLSKIMRYLKKSKRKHKHKHQKHKHQKRKHRHTPRHHHHKRKKHLRAYDIEPLGVQGNMRDRKTEETKATPTKTFSDQTSKKDDKIYNSITPFKNFDYYDHTTQVYEIREEHLRRNDVNKIRQLTEETDEEIPLKMNLYKALNVYTYNHPISVESRQINDNLKTANSEIDDSSEELKRINAEVKKNVDLMTRKYSASGSDEENVLKRKMYTYFNNNRDV